MAELKTDKTADQKIEKKATRAAYGETLIELLNEGIDVVAVDADLSGSTTTAKLAKVAPERHFNVGIAEQNMICVAAGLSLAGKTAFTGSFAVFGTGRAYDQIRNTVCYAQLNVKIAPTHAGISVCADGGSHQMVEDIALMRALPNMRVLVPADYPSAKTALRLAAQTPGPVYVRMGRSNVPIIYDDSSPVTTASTLNLGTARVVREGSDVTLVACGVEVDQALQAAELLAADGVSAEVIDAFSIKPLDEKTILESVRKTGAVVTCEEHSVIGGLGSAVAELLVEQPDASVLLRKPLQRIGVQDRFGTSGDFDELFAEFALDAQAIYNRVKQL
ncbi:MAG: transketolase family protein [Coriobacteriales bacterium]|jgi:transketolase|nr:transketolase family protein [Coriobacteriales bacterium]